MTMRDKIEAKMQTRFAPETLEIVDESFLHAGHSGARPGGETHFQVFVTSPAFAGLNRVARHRLVFDTLKDELAEGVHALGVHARAPGEP